MRDRQPRRPGRPADHDRAARRDQVAGAADVQADLRRHRQARVPVPGNRAQACPPKTCVEVSCLSFTETRLSMQGLCITMPLLVERAWPEWRTYFVERVLVAHAHKINAWTLVQTEAKATAVVITPPTDPLLTFNGW
ncbi:major capsid protein [Actinomadura sp. J1-007]|nr:major capsid protein [Actinomadura sp. J1-007]MWK37183.1 major capsid protein [Actinomadura sp. J1-007]